MGIVLNFVGSKIFHVYKDLMLLQQEVLAVVEVRRAHRPSDIEQPDRAELCALIDVEIVR